MTIESELGITVGQNGRFHPKVFKMLKPQSTRTTPNNPVQLRLSKNAGGSGGFGLFLGRNGQKPPKKGQKIPKIAIFDHSLNL